MPDFPIVPAKTAMLFFDTLNVYLHPADPGRAASINASGVVDRMAKINKACRDAGIAIFYGQADHRQDGREFAAQIVERGHQGKPGEPPRLTTAPSAMSGTKEAEVIAELAPQP